MIRNLRYGSQYPLLGKSFLLSYTAWIGLILQNETKGSRITTSATRLARLANATRGITATGDLEPIYLREPHITLPKARPPL